MAPHVWRICFDPQRMAAVALYQARRYRHAMLTALLVGLLALLLAAILDL